YIYTFNFIQLLKGAHDHFLSLLLYHKSAMNYKLIKDIINLVEEFEDQMPSASYNADVEGFKQWLQAGKSGLIAQAEEPYWEGKENGRSPESTINTLIVHMNRYAKTYSRSAISDSDFSTQEDFIYLI